MDESSGRYDGFGETEASDLKRDAVVEGLVTKHAEAARASAVRSGDDGNIHQGTKRKQRRKRGKIRVPIEVDR